MDIFIVGSRSYRNAINLEIFPTAWIERNANVIANSVQTNIVICEVPSNLHTVGLCLLSSNSRRLFVSTVSSGWHCRDPCERPTRLYRKMRLVSGCLHCSIGKFFFFDEVHIDVCLGVLTHPDSQSSALESCGTKVSDTMPILSLIDGSLFNRNQRMWLPRLCS